MLKNITLITPEWLQKHNIDALILDIDNTLTEHNSFDISPEVSDWINTMKQNNIKLSVLSNNNYARVKPFADKIGVQFVSEGKKPLPTGVKKALKIMDSDKSSTMIVGDQIFTDVLCGNLSKIRVVLLDPISEETQSFLKFKRKIEKLFDLRNKNKTIAKGE